MAEPRARETKACATQVLPAQALALRHRIPWRTDQRVRAVREDLGHHVGFRGREAGNHQVQPPVGQQAQQGGRAGPASASGAGRDAGVQSRPAAWA